MGVKEDFLQKAKSRPWDAAADFLNGCTMYDILPCIAALGGDRASAMQSIIGVFKSRNWQGNADRLSWANDVVRTQSVPAPPPGLPADQMLDARLFLQKLKAGRGATPFDLVMTSPLRKGWTKGLGGLGQGDHSSADWFIGFGMDLGCPKGTEVHAAFDGYVMNFNPHIPAKDSARVYGAQIWIYTPNDKVGAFYTHLTDCRLAVRQQISRGQLLGTIMADHIHFALNEVVAGKHVGVNLYQKFLTLEDTDRQITATFKQDGTAPTAS